MSSASESYCAGEVAGGIGVLQGLNRSVVLSVLEFSSLAERGSQIGLRSVVPSVKEIKMSHTQSGFGEERVENSIYSCEQSPQGPTFEFCITYLK